MKPTGLATATMAVATCPSCHTALPAMPAVDTEDFHCVRCGQRWDALRLATTAAYRAWDAERAGRVVKVV